MFLILSCYLPSFFFLPFVLTFYCGRPWGHKDEGGMVADLTQFSFGSGDGMKFRERC